MISDIFNRNTHQKKRTNSAESVELMTQRSQTDNNNHIACSNGNNDNNDNSNKTTSTHISDIRQSKAGGCSEIIRGIFITILIVNFDVVCMLGIWCELSSCSRLIITYLCAVVSSCSAVSSVCVCAMFCQAVLVLCLIMIGFESIFGVWSELFALGEAHLDVFADALLYHFVLQCRSYVCALFCQGVLVLYLIMAVESPAPAAPACVACFVRLFDCFSTTPNFTYWLTGCCLIMFCGVGCM